MEHESREPGTRALGGSPLRVPPVVHGVWQFGGWYWGEADDAAARRTVRAALDAGPCAFDTAPAYGMGHSEAVLGESLAGRRDEALILTKCGLRWDDDRGKHFFDMQMPDGSSVPLYRNLRPDSVRAECEASLRRLRTGVIDLYQCHWPDPTTPVEETMGAMADLCREGKIRAVGVSNFSPEEMDRARSALGEIPLASDQPKYNLLDRRIEDGILPYLREHGIGCLVYSPLEQGLLGGRMTSDRVLAAGDLRSRRWEFTPENRDRVNRLIDETVRPLADSRGATPAQIALAWILHRPGITSVIAGVRGPAQVEENVGAGRLRLEQPEVETLTHAFSRLELIRPA